MVFKIIKNVLIALCWTIVLGPAFIGISDPDLLMSQPHDEGHNQWVSWALLAAGLWLEEPILFTIIFVLVIVWQFGYVKNQIEKISIDGYKLILTFQALYVVLFMGYISLNDTVYPLPYPRNWDNGYESMLAVVFFIWSSFGYKSFLISFNGRLSKPSSIFMIILPFLPFYFGFSVWWHYAYTGVLDFLWFI